MMNFEPINHWEPIDTEHYPECDLNIYGDLPCSCEDIDSEDDCRLERERLCNQVIRLLRKKARVTP